ncbi:MAG: beta-galactosidase trimerization domain-containing protein, partial [Candidatus Ratteibacteria bacterium]|nr:beta-galactosidase trimerization domain-containing protein [Candidatus Ratteibacteria bacterium]
VMCHVGMCLPIQDVLDDTSDDILNSQAVEIYGTSIPFGSGEFFSSDENSDIATFKNSNRRHFYIVNLIPDWLRGVKRDFYSYEIYANTLHYQLPDLIPEDIRFYTYSQVAAGARGVCFWQYKAERLGNESICSGLVNIDGRQTERSREIEKIIKEIKKERDVLENYEVEKGKVAIVYDFRSDIISRLEHTTEENKKKGMVDYIYKRAFKGIYRGFFLLNILPDLIDIRNLKKILAHHFYPFLYLPSPLVLNEEDASILKEYVDAGGTLISENCLGFREENTWVRAHSFPYELRSVFGIEESIPKRLRKKIYNNYLTFDVDDVITNFKIEGADILARWEDGSAAMTVNRYGKGKAVAIGFHPGLMENTDAFLRVLCKEVSLFPEIETEGMVILRKGRSGDKKVLFIFNYEDKKQKVSLNGLEIEVGGRDVKQVVIKEGKRVQTDDKVIAERR